MMFLLMNVLSEVGMYGSGKSVTRAGQPVLLGGGLYT